MMPDLSMFFLRNAYKILPVSARDMCSKAKYVNTFNVPQSKKCLALDRVVR